MKMHVTFTARYSNDSRIQEVTEAGEGATEQECIEHAEARVIGCDYVIVSFEGAVDEWADETTEPTHPGA